MVQVTSPTSLIVDSPQGRKLFVFDKVFGEDVHQEGVWDYLSESVGAFVQGYNVSVMAYGQSGAGKSYTMGTSGPSEQSDPHLMGKPLLRTRNEEDMGIDCSSSCRCHSSSGSCLVREAHWAASIGQEPFFWHQDTKQILNHFGSYLAKPCQGSNRQNMADESYIRRGAFLNPGLNKAFLTLPLYRSITNNCAIYLYPRACLLVIEVPLR